MVSALTKLANGNLELTITIPQSEIKAAEEKVLQQEAREITVKGFRKGKAPLNLVKQKLDKKILYEKVIKALIPKVYLEAVKEHQLKPIISPEVKITNLEENKDWQIKAITCQWPTVELGDYRQEIKKAFAGEKIWTPEKAKEIPEKPNQEDKTAKLFKVLLEHIKVKAPEILIEQEVQRMLSRLVNQTSQVGLTIEQYLASIKKTSQQLRADYRKQAEETLKLEFILAKIGEREKVTVPEAEVDKMIATIPDEKTRDSLKSPQQRQYIKQIIQKRKIIDNLLNL